MTKTAVQATDASWTAGFDAAGVVVGEQSTIDSVSEAMQRHHLAYAVDADADRNHPCTCGRWADAEDESWDDHMAEVAVTTIVEILAARLA
jgi:hypothetical protein